MKTLIVFFLVVLKYDSATQILHPVKWDFSITKISDKTYQFKATAEMESQWHIYAQNQPEDAISSPTAFLFDKQVGVKLIGKVKEIGKMIKYIDKKNNILANEYGGQVEFVQTIRITDPSKAKLSGKVTYQSCTDRQCLQPEDIKFSVDLK